MRACDGCRRRKIKCDAATTNTWPCGGIACFFRFSRASLTNHGIACTRLKLTCIPPTVSYEKDLNGGSQTFEVNPPQQYRTVDHVQIYQPTIPQAAPTAQPLPPSQVTGSYPTAFQTYPQTSYLDLPSLPHTSISSAGVGNSSFSYPQPAYDPSYHHPQAGDLAWSGDMSPDNLAEALGELSIDHTGVGTVSVCSIHGGSG